MPFHRLPDDLVSLIAKHAVIMEVEDYGPSEHEWLWAALPEHPFMCRVSEVLYTVNMPPLACHICDQNALRRLDRTGHGAPVWQLFCPGCEFMAACEEVD